MNSTSIRSIQGFKILCLKTNSKRCFHRTTEEEEGRDFLFTYVSKRGKCGETFFVAEGMAEDLLDEALRLPKKYKVSIKFK